MRFGNGRDGLNGGPGERAAVTCSRLEQKTSVDFPAIGPEASHIPRNACPKHRQKMPPNAVRAILKGSDHNTINSS